MSFSTLSSSTSTARPFSRFVLCSFLFRQRCSSQFFFLTLPSSLVAGMEFMSPLQQGHGDLRVQLKSWNFHSTNDPSTVWTEDKKPVTALVDPAAGYLAASPDFLDTLDSLLDYDTRDGDRVCFDTRADLKSGLPTLRIDFPVVGTGSAPGGAATSAEGQAAEDTAASAPVDIDPDQYTEQDKKDPDRCVRLLWRRSPDKSVGLVLGQPFFKTALVGYRLCPTGGGCIQVITVADKQTSLLQDLAFGTLLLVVVFFALVSYTIVTRKNRDSERWSRGTPSEDSGSSPHFVCHVESPSGEFEGYYTGGNATPDITCVIQSPLSSDEDASPRFDLINYENLGKEVVRQCFSADSPPPTRMSGLIYSGAAGTGSSSSSAMRQHEEDQVGIVVPGSTSSYNSKHNPVVLVPYGNNSSRNTSGILGLGAAEYSHRVSVSSALSDQADELDSNRRFTATKSNSSSWMLPNGGADQMFFQNYIPPHTLHRAAQGAGFTSQGPPAQRAKTHVGTGANTNGAATGSSGAANNIQGRVTFPSAVPPNEDASNPASQPASKNSLLKMLSDVFKSTSADDNRASGMTRSSRDSSKEQQSMLTRSLLRK
ncbi:unnamed protein product [Amoebophrya sp. A120]|nr:unnamed protein product [Amoebophrya sp. A120]|eukprot:GSA120T00018547001.1